MYMSDTIPGSLGSNLLLLVITLLFFPLIISSLCLWSMVSWIKNLTRAAREERRKYSEGNN